MLNLYSSKIYKYSPVLLQNGFITIQGLVSSRVRRGQWFRHLQEELLRNESLTSEELEAMQLAKLGRLLQHAYQWVPYYTRLFDRLGLRPEDFQSIEDLKKLPLLEKETVRELGEEFIARNANRIALIKGATSGTTGSPLSLYMNRELIESEHAFVWRQYRWAGRPWNGRTAVFLGDLIVPVEQDRPPFWRYDAHSRELYFSTYHLSEHTAEAYSTQLRLFDPSFIYAYPSILYALAGFLKKHDPSLSFGSLRGIVTSSETLCEHQKTMIEDVFKARVFDWYGLFERVIFIGTCPFGSYHVFPDYGITEYIPAGMSGSNRLYELVGTGFSNLVFPLVRYRTGDIVSLAEGDCPCGRHFPRVNCISGRENDAIVTPSGRRICMVDSVFKGENIRFAQIVQKSLRELDVLVVPGPGYTISDENKLIAEMKLRVGGDMQVAVKVVADIPRLPNGKFKLIVTQLGRHLQ